MRRAQYVEAEKMVKYGLQSGQRVAPLWPAVNVLLPPECVHHISQVMILPKFGKVSHTHCTINYAYDIHSPIFIYYTQLCNSAYMFVCSSQVVSTIRISRFQMQTCLWSIVLLQRSALTIIIIINASVSSLGSPLDLGNPWRPLATCLKMTNFSQISKFWRLCPLTVWWENGVQ